jgi:hypothetical protein
MKTDDAPLTDEEIAAHLAVCEAATAPKWHRGYGLLEHAPHWAVCVVAPAVISATDDHDAELIVLAVNNYARALREIQRLRAALAMPREHPSRGPR